MSCSNFNRTNRDNTTGRLCNDGTQQRAFVFDGTNFAPSMSVIQGASTLQSTDLSDFFIPLMNYQSFDFMIPESGSIEINAKNLINSGGEVQFIGILVIYPEFDDSDCPIDTDDQYLTWQYPIGVNTFNLGKIMFLSGSTKPGFGWDLNASPGGFLINNPHDNFCVEIKVLVFE